MRKGIDRRGMALLSGGHCATDFASGTVPALLPFLTDKFDLGYTLTAVLMLAVLLSSSLMQPLFGLWSDRRGAPWLIPGGIALAGAGICLVGTASSYGLAVALIFVSGIGIAAFHPEGAKAAVFVSGHKRASGMSLFNIGGNVGYASGPIIVTALVLWLGIGAGTALASLPVLAFAVVALAGLRYLAARRPTDEMLAQAAGAERDDVRAMLLLTSVIGFRSVAWFGLLTFVPLWLVSLGDSTAQGNHLLSLMLVSGAAGTLVLGPIGDRFGLRRTLVVTQALLTPAILLFVLVGGIAGAVGLVVVGMCVVGTFGVTTVLSQMYLPQHVGMASGFSVGLSMGLGGIAAVGLGAVADAVDLRVALICCALAPLLGVVTSLLLPAPHRAPSVAVDATPAYPLLD